MGLSALARGSVFGVRLAYFINIVCADGRRDTLVFDTLCANRTKIGCRSLRRRTLSYRVVREVRTTEREMMANRNLNNVLGQIRKLSAVAGAADATEAELLARFVEAQVEVAFGMLVKRHSSMVLSVCQRVLAHAQDAEDACQATFLLLAQQATSIRKTASLSSWLHGVAHRLAAIRYGARCFRPCLLRSPVFP
jgi:hypothetical protein